MNRIFVFLTLQIILVLFSGTTSAADYWPMDNGPIYHYENSVGHEIIVSYSGEYQIITNPEITWVIGKRFTMGSDGDVLQYSYSSMSEGDIDPDEWVFEPEVKFLDYPLFVGKTWASSTVSHFYPFNFFSEVISEGMVSVPMGTYEAVELLVTVVPQMGDWGGTYFLNREIGPVILPGGYYLVSIENTVTTESYSWEFLKSLYR